MHITFKRTRYNIYVTFCGDNYVTINPPASLQIIDCYIWQDACNAHTILLVEEQFCPTQTNNAVLIKNYIKKQHFELVALSYKVDDASYHIPQA